MEERREERERRDDAALHVLAPLVLATELELGVAAFVDDARAERDDVGAAAGAAAQIACSIHASVGAELEAGPRGVGRLLRDDARGLVASAEPGVVAPGTDGPLVSDETGASGPLASAPAGAAVAGTTTTVGAGAAAAGAAGGAAPWGGAAGCTGDMPDWVCANAGVDDAASEAAAPRIETAIENDTRRSGTTTSGARGCRDLARPHAIVPQKGNSGLRYGRSRRGPGSGRSVRVVRDSRVMPRAT